MTSQDLDSAAGPRETDENPSEITEVPADSLTRWRDLASLRVNVALLVTAALSSLILLREETQYPGTTTFYPALGATAFLALLLRFRQRIPSRVRSLAMLATVGIAVTLSMIRYGFATPNQFVIVSTLGVLAALLLGKRLAWTALALFAFTTGCVGFYFVMERPLIVGRTDVYDADNWIRIVLIFAVMSGMAVWAVALFSDWLAGALSHTESALRALRNETRARARLAARERELEAQLREARLQGSLGTLSGGIARDFKNLLAIVLQGADMAYQEKDAEDRAAALDLIKSAGRRGSDLADRLLEYSRGQSARQHWFSPNDAISDALPLVQQLFPPNIELVFERGRNVGHVRAAPAHLDQLLLGLCTHARDRIPEGGSVTLRTSLGPDEARDEICFSVLCEGRITPRTPSYAEELLSDTAPETPRSPVSASVRKLVELLQGRLELRVAGAQEEEVVVILPRGEPPAPIPLSRAASE